MSGSPPVTVSFAISLPHVLVQDDASNLHSSQLASSDGGSAIQADKAENEFEDKEDNWEYDPVNPRNWSPARKWIAISVVSVYTFVAPLASSIMAPGLPDIAVKYGITNPTVIALTMSIFLLSFAMGPLFMAPFSEIYGRVWVLHISNLFLLAFNVGCAVSPNVSSLIVFRFLAGLAGSAPLACGGGVVADLFVERERASAMAVYGIGPLLGPCIGPIMGGFIAESVGVQYVYYVITSISGVAAVFGILLLGETYAPVIRLRRDKVAQNPEKSAAEHPALTPHSIGRWAYLWINLKRPVVLLTRSFICFILSLYTALLYGIFYLMFATFPTLFTDVYHFNTGIEGFTYLGIGLGFSLSAIIGVRICDKIYANLAAKNGGNGNPEMRIPILIFGSFFVPVGLLWYGWSAQAHIHFMMPIIGTAIYGFGLMSCFFAVQLYLIDTFVYAASALAAASVFRSLLAFAFPLFGEQMFVKLGYGGGNSLLAGLAIVFGIPFPIWLYYAGEDIRARSTLAH